MAHYNVMSSKKREGNGKKKKSPKGYMSYPNTSYIKKKGK